MKNKQQFHMKKNIIGEEIVKPLQVLIIMRGVSGVGKSTKAREIASNGGEIYSTDDRIKESGVSVSDFYTSAKRNRDFSKVTEMHNLNLKYAIKAMKDGVSPVVIDNTNINYYECEPYIKAALKMGYDHRNIKIMDLGVSRFSSKTLSERNVNGVSESVIDKQKESIKKVGKISIKKMFTKNF